MVVGRYSRIGRLSWLAIVVLLAGCMIGPDYATPQAAQAAQRQDADNAAVDTTREESGRS